MVLELLEAWLRAVCKCDVMKCILMHGHHPICLPSVNVVRVSQFNVEHALSCAKGGFPSLRHNEIRDITASLLTEVCSEVCAEPENYSL